jgi:hypothetical protein
MSKDYTGTIHVRGMVDIRNGDYHQQVKNHFVNNMLFSLTNWFAATGSTAVTPTYQWATSPYSYAYLMIGNSTIPTNIAIDGLENPLGILPIGTLANSQAGSTAELTNGAKLTLAAGWNPTTISGTVKEMGLYLYSSPSLTTFGGGYPVTQRNFSSRLSTADGDFSAFTINTAHTLNISWTISFTFA